jgi:hypothetical protein
LAALEDCTRKTLCASIQIPEKSVDAGHDVSRVENINQFEENRACNETQPEMIVQLKFHDAPLLFRTKNLL